MGGGKRKPELETQTKRVTQKQKPRNTKNKKTKTYQMTQSPGSQLRAPAPLAVNLSTSQFVSGPQHDSKNTTGAGNNT